MIGDGAEYQIGLNGRTCCDEENVRSWKGLSAADAELLRLWVCGCKGGVEQFHTDVYLGELPTWWAEAMARGAVQGVQRSYLLRVDCVACVAGEWFGIECKPDASAKAVGQVVTYRYWWTRQVPRVCPIQWTIVTDNPSSHILGVCQQLGIVVVPMGEDVLEGVAT
jgi:hypothetical protein